MPNYEFKCDNCGSELEEVQPMNGIPPSCPECGVVMRKKISSPSMIRIKGRGYPSRRKWMENWTPDSSKFSTGSLHGERY